MRIAADSPQNPQPDVQSPGAWRLVRTPNPRGGPDAVSIMRTADLIRSDANLAGMMFRCGKTAIETLLVVVAPLPPDTKPTVKISSGGTAASFDATIVAPFVLILLPPDAAALFTGRWRTSTDEISVEIDENDETIRGYVALAGLNDALGQLTGNCPVQ